MGVAGPGLAATAWLLSAWIGVVSRGSAWNGTPRQGAAPNGVAASDLGLSLLTTSLHHPTKQEGLMATKKQAAPKAPTGESETMNLPKLDIRTAVVEIVGTSPLIVHAWGEKSKRQMREKQQKLAKMAKEAKDPEADFESSKYLNAERKDCVPAGAFRNAIISSGRFADGIPMTKITGSVFFPDNLVPLAFDKCVMREDMVRVGGKGPGTGTADLRYRAEYQGWKVKLRVEYNATIISLEQLLNLVSLAGFSVGICEWRPEKKGQFGRFTVGQVIGEKAAA
jgi:hypothetical protein